MSDDLEILGIGMRTVVRTMDNWFPRINTPVGNTYAEIRFELLRLTQENAELHKSALGGYEDGWHALRNERDALKAELAKLRARIAESPVVKVRGKVGEFATIVVSHSLVGKRVRILAEDEAEREAKES